MCYVTPYVVFAVIFSSCRVTCLDCRTSTMGMVDASFGTDCTEWLVEWPRLVETGTLSSSVSGEWLLNKSQLLGSIQLLLNQLVHVIDRYKWCLFQSNFPACTRYVTGPNRSWTTPLVQVVPRLRKSLTISGSPPSKPRWTMGLNFLDFSKRKFFSFGAIKSELLRCVLFCWPTMRHKMQDTRKNCIPSCSFSDSGCCNGCTFSLDSTDLISSFNQSSTTSVVFLGKRDNASAFPWFLDARYSISYV